MVDKRNAGAAAPQVNAPEVMMPQESRAEVDRLVDLMNKQDTAEQWALKVFLQGMEFQRALHAAALAAGRADDLRRGATGRRAVRLKRGAAWG